MTIFASQGATSEHAWTPWGVQIVNPPRALSLSLQITEADYGNEIDEACGVEGAVAFTKQSNVVASIEVPVVGEYFAFALGCEEDQVREQSCRSSIAVDEWVNTYQSRVAEIPRSRASQSCNVSHREHRSSRVDRIAPEICSGATPMLVSRERCRPPHVHTAS